MTDLGPQYRAWVKWRKGGRKGKRPKTPLPVPRAWWVRYAEERRIAASTTTPKPPAPKSVFAGINMFSAWQPALTFPLQGIVDGVAIRPDLCPEPVAFDLKRRGFQLFVWEDFAREGQAAVDRFGAVGYIAQSETPDEQRAALTVHDALTVPRALVGRFWLPGWTSLLETYGVAVPSDLGPGFPVLGLTDGNEQPFALANYVPSLGARRDFWVYLAEKLSDADIETLRGLRG